MDTFQDHALSAVLERSASRRGVVAALMTAAALGSAPAAYAAPEVRRIGLNPAVAFIDSGVVDPDPAPVTNNTVTNNTVNNISNLPLQYAVVGGEIVGTLPATGVGTADDGS